MSLQAAKKIFLISLLIPIALLFQNFQISTPSATPEGFQGKSYVGYQAWFNTDQDGTGRDWTHWGRHKPLQASSMLVDMWPDTAEYPNETLQDSGFRLGNHTSAKLFSSAYQATTDLHFKWMKDYNIDGAFLQWFIVEPTDYRLRIAQNVKRSAEKNGREFSIMFDISGTENDPGCSSANELVECIKQRWITAVDNGLTSSASYTRYQNKPLVSIWGLGFNHTTHLTPDEAMNLINWFKVNAPQPYQASVMGGVGAGWRTLSLDTSGDSRWNNVFARLDIISPWTVGRFGKESDVVEFAKTVVKPDIDLVLSRNQKYLPVIFPGFSWVNLNQGPANQIPRLAGQFMWAQAREMAKLNLTSLYTAMFDEVDEGTAIFKVSENKSKAPQEFYTVTADADGKSLPSDWYLQVSQTISNGLKNDLSSVADNQALPLLPQYLKFNAGELLLNAGESRANDLIMISLQTDGNFVLYDKTNSKALWATNTQKECNVQKCIASFQGDGNLVLYQSGVPYWASNTAGSHLKLIFSKTAPYYMVNSSGVITPVVPIVNPLPSPITTTPVQCVTLEPTCEGKDYVRRDSCGKELGRWTNAPPPYCPQAGTNPAPVLTPQPAPPPVQCVTLEPTCEGKDWVRRDSCGKELGRWSNAPPPYCPGK